MQIILDSISNFLNSWHVVVMVLGVVFIVLTGSAWMELIKKLSVYVKRNNIVVTTDPQVNIDDAEDYIKIQKTLSDLQLNADKEFIDFLASVKQHLLQRNLNRHEVRELIHSIFTIKEQYEFAYLNLFLVTNSKHALRTLYDLGSATKNVFLSQVVISEELGDDDQQREIIFNALLCHHLIESDTALCEVSEKGKRFLAFIGLV